MKKIITGMLFASCLTVVNFAHAQNVAPQNSGATYFHRCGEAEYEDFLRSKDPLYDIKKQDAENLIAKKVKEIEDAKKAGHPLPNTTYTIPVVFHVVYNTANATAENISDQQVQYAFAQLNQDWSRTNTDAGNTPAVWQSIAVNMGIQYCLATKDPNGATTTGIVHKATSSTSFTTDDKVKSSAQGGDDPWDVTKYLNIWICNLGSSLLGYGAFPTSPIPSTWGTVVHYISIGSLTHPNSAGGTFGYGRTLSHEIGHCFNLYHIWGDDAGACTGSDAVSDTPNMADATSGCPTGVVTDACGAGTDGSPASSSAPGRMYQNYMDYTDDMCYNMFTAGQKTKAQSAIATWLMTVANNASTACNTTVYALDAGVNAIVSPGGISCNASITPVVTLENYGSSTLTTCKILYNIDGGANQSYNWTGSLATNASVNVTLPAMTVAAGTHTFTSASSAPNSGTDGNTTNDLSSVTFNVASTQAPPLQQVFAAATPFPPTPWSINNPDGTTTWAYSTVNYPTSTGGSMFMDDFNYNGPGQTDDFISPPLNLASATSPSITFEVAYELYTNPTASPNYSDTLRVDVSTNCGTTWSNLYFKYSTALTTTTPAFATTAFAPTTAAQWRLESLNLPIAPSVMVRFHHTCGYENNMYIDDINIVSQLAVNETSLDNYVSVYPNPSNGLVNVNISARDLGQVSVKVFNMLGEMVSETNDHLAGPKTFKLDLEGQAKGMYFINIKAGNASSVKKVMIN